MKKFYETPEVEQIRLETACHLLEESPGASAPEMDQFDFDWGD